MALSDFLNIFKPSPDISGYRLTWRPSPKDERDLKFSAIAAPAMLATPIPEVCDLSAQVPEVFDQGSVGSCTGNAGAMLGLFQSRRQKREITPSRLMLYYGAREIIGETDQDNGAYIRDIFKAWAKVGVAPESTWPYNENKVTAKPSDEAYEVGKYTLATQYRAIDNTVLDELKLCLAMGYPFNLGFFLPKSFMYGTWRDTMPMPKQGEQTLGGHAVTAIGYDNTRRAFRIKNSWGADWKDKGHFWMPYDFITNPEYCSDFWMLTGITPAETPVPTPTNITSVVDLKKVFKVRKYINCLRKDEMVLLGKEMGLNTDTAKTKAQNLAIVAGGLGL